MKNELLSELKKKYAGQATTKYLESLADRLAEKVKEEKDIEGVLSELEASPVKIGDLQVEGDRRVAEMKAKQKELEDKIAEMSKKPEPKTDPKPDDRYAELEAKLSEVEKRAKQQEARAVFMEKIKDRKIPGALLSDVTIGSVDEVDGIIEGLEAKATALKKELGIEGFEGKPPRRGDQEPNRTQIEEDLKKYKPK